MTEFLDKTATVAAPPPRPSTPSSPNRPAPPRASATRWLWAGLALFAASFLVGLALSHYVWR